MENMKNFINYYGGKFRAAKMYPYPSNNLIIEPFAGAAGYSIRHHTKKVKLYEVDNNLVCMWDFLIKSSYDDIISLPINFESVNDLNIPDGAKILIGFCINTGSAVPCNIRSKWSRENPEHPTFWGIKRRLRIAEQVKNIKHWEIIKINDYSDIQNEKATWFIDPPYQKQGIYYKHSSKNIDFCNLSKWCLDRKGEIIVCEQEGADWLPWNNKKEIKSNIKTNKSCEVWYHQIFD